MRHRGLAVVLVVSILVPLAAAAESDYNREKKWADEIVPRIVMGAPVFLEDRAGRKFLSIYTEASNAKAGLVIVHGLGAHPDWGLIGRLRTDLADEGYTTLSVQMPVLAQAATSEEYLSTLPEAGDRLKVAADFLRAKGYMKIAIVSHSMGSRMTYYYLTRDPKAAVSAWVCIGWENKGDDFSQISVPVLDLYGENDFTSVLEGAKRRAASIKNVRRSQQIMAPKADHFFNGSQTDLIRYVKKFLDKSLP